MLLVIPKVLGPESVASLRTRLAELEFHDGKETARGSAQRVKANRQLTASNPDAAKLAQEVVNALSSHVAFSAATLPKQIVLPMFSRYADGEHYGKHLDVPVMGRAPKQVRTDISVTVFLSDPGEYEGGELRLHVHGGTRSVKADAGDVFIYPSNTLHEVTPVASGERWVAVTWIQSLVADALRREVLFDLATTLRRVEAREGQDEEVLNLRKCHYNLLRMWAEA